MKTKVQLRNMIRLLDAMSEVVIWQCDVYKDGPEYCEPELIYEGTVMDIPWYIMDYYFYRYYL